jgi:hypothetical protein
VVGLKAGAWGRVVVDPPGGVQVAEAAGVAML